MSFSSPFLCIFLCLKDTFVAGKIFHSKEKICSWICWNLSFLCAPSECAYSGAVCEWFHSNTFHTLAVLFFFLWFMHSHVLWFV